MAQVVRYYLTIISDDLACRILKSNNGISPSSDKHITKQSLVQQQYELYEDVRVTIAMRWNRNTNTMREHSRRVSP